MCFFCDGGTLEQLLHEVAANIERVGWFVSGVTGTDHRLDWAYTIGLAERFDHPELVVTEVSCFGCACAWLNRIGERIAGGQRFADGDHVAAPSGAPVRLREVHPAHWGTDRFNLWLEYYAGRPDCPPARALQVLVPSTTGRRARHEHLDRPPAAPHCFRR